MSSRRNHARVLSRSRLLRRLRKARLRRRGCLLLASAKCLGRCKSGVDRRKRRCHHIRERFVRSCASFRRVAADFVRHSPLRVTAYSGPRTVLFPAQILFAQFLCSGQTLASVVELNQDLGLDCARLGQPVTAARIKMLGEMVLPRARERKDSNRMWPSRSLCRLPISLPSDSHPLLQSQRQRQGSMMTRLGADDR